MTRVEITVGLLAILGAIAITALIGLGEPVRMPRAEVGYKMRKAESGAQMFEQYCSNCHGPNAVGAICPPLDETSGLYGGDLGPGVAWRLEQLGWDRQLAFEYVVSTISRGVPISTRPNQYPGNRNAENPNDMAMPAWAQIYGGPLRPDQVTDLATYLTNFRENIPNDIEEAKAVALGDLKDPVARNANIAADAQATDIDRSAGEGKENWIVMVGSCTHLGCVPLGQAGDFGGWFCPCHGSHYDTAGRIRQGPAPQNLAVPPYAFLSDTQIKIG